MINISLKRVLNQLFFFSARKLTLIDDYILVKLKLKMNLDYLERNFFSLIHIKLLVYNQKIYSILAN